MGCCVSTKNNSKTPSTLQKTRSLPQPSSPNQDSRAPPPSFEEEKVKEILLSEVPKAPPLSDNFKDSIFTLRKEEINFQETDKDLSQNCSESISTTASCDNNNDYKRFNLEDENEVKQKIMKSPNLRNSSARVDSGRRQSPVRRYEQSPVRKNNVGSVKLVQSKQTGSGQNGRFGSRSDQHARDPNERSGRMSRSPGHNSSYRSNVTRSPSLRKTNGSPGRVTLDPNVNGGSRRVLSGVEDTWRSGNSGGGVAHESLENPLVSLECFIFL